MKTRPGSGEFEIIERYFRPLSSGEPGALALTDDAALMDVAPGHTLVATTDLLIAGVHFFPADPAGLIARKLLRVNLSDLAAMGARPRAYLLSCGFPADVKAEWLQAFSDGLAEDQRTFGVSLVGGDTVASPGPLIVSVTALGEVPRGAALLRSGARVGDTVFVSGTIGDAALGLRILRGEASAPADWRAALVDRYHLPRPRVALGQALRGIARAAIDVSDGLAGDMGHVCETSGVGAVIDWPKVPLSPAARQLLARDPALRPAILGGGDDYELLFTAAPESASGLADLAARHDVAVTAIGRITEGEGVVVRDAEGAEIALASPGYRHFKSGAP